MSLRKILMLAGLTLIAFPLPRSDMVSRIAAECNCDRTKMACRIQCSGIGSGTGTGGGSSTFRVVPDGERPAQSKSIVVPPAEPDRSTGLNK